MTEERMIRVTEYSLNFIEEQIRMDPNQKIAYWGELEPAPPKDWRPICYDSQYNKLNGCDPGRIITNTCQQCPWLAARHKTEVNRKIKGLMT